jgi:hypothetical protein
MRRLPKTFTEKLPEGVQAAYAIIPQIKNLPEPLRRDVRQAFAESTAVIWYALLGVAAIGLLSNL